ncbi:hypothetical protein OM076_43285 [Solirubrobacter ginsenosidimutans]|uniref:Conjugal transfer protein TrbC n=1 Tax=Solirubrobacter ginsenosidimutans TaxID=490573 RepID=A0A9X3N4W7_9ACTN|nr:hypothetical protein [Solirubrobacter ginsenosidimutans]MDA0167163.1 hypothetical protein [Solirubrobacter ginsenosidimutans]
MLLIRAAACCSAAAYASLAIAHAHALRAAGVTGKAPANAAAIEKFVSTITDNALWVIGTTSGLAGVVIGGLFFFGHSRAADYALKILIGAVVIVSSGGLAA